MHEPCRSSQGRGWVHARWLHVAHAMRWLALNLPSLPHLSLTVPLCLQTSSDTSLQTPLMCALRWVDSPTLPSPPAPPGTPAAESQRDTSDPYAWLTSSTDDLMAQSRGPSSDAGDGGSGSGSSGSRSSSSDLGGSREGDSKAGVDNGRAGPSNAESSVGQSEEEMIGGDSSLRSDEEQTQGESDGGTGKAGGQGHDMARSAVSGRQDEWNGPQAEKQVMQLAPGDLRCLLPPSTELLSFAGLQPAAGKECNSFMVHDAGFCTKVWLCLASVSWRNV